MRKGELTRNRIVTEAAEVFNRLGFASTSMSELMAVTGLEKGGLYRHFGTKEELAVAAFRHAVELCEEARLAPIEALPPGERLPAFIRNFVHGRVPIAGGCPIFNTAVESDDGNPSLRGEARKAFQRWVATLTRWTEEAQAAGAIDSALPAKEVALHVFCTLQGALIARNLVGSGGPLLAAEATLLRHLQACAPPPRRRR